MNITTEKAAQVLLMRAKSSTCFNLNVSGNSMFPVLQDGDIISVCKKSEYEIGDILVFIYKNGDILVHRLLNVKDNRYFCKGDNSFRLEDIGVEQIIGAVILENDPNHSINFIHDSYAINRIFRKCKYDITMTKETAEYVQYWHKYLCATLK